MPISAFYEEPPIDEEDSPGVGGQCCQDPPDPPHVGIKAHDLPILGVVEGTGEEEEDVQSDESEDDGEDYIPPPQFEETDSDEREEDMDMGYSETEDEGRPDVQYNRDDPSLAEGTIFSDIIDCRNALATFSIKTQSEFIIDKSEPSRLTVHCAYERCQSEQDSSHMPKCYKEAKAQVRKE
ncbi:hypothetical protein D1007_32220 [Hordeum vulgare]|nr:hypothetical protein D1007_32220 [Hordeum vulgare]